MLTPQIALLASLLVGWADIKVQPSRGDRAFSSSFRSIASLEAPSERTIETLKRNNLDRRYRRDPEGAISSLEKAAQVGADSDLVFALAELSWIDGRRLDRRRRPGSLDRYYDTVAFAYDFLFDTTLANGRQPSDPRFRVACDLYNGGLDRLIRAAQVDGKIQPGDTIHLKIRGQKQDLRVELQHSPWSREDVGELIFASDFEVTGLDSRSRQYGLGVPLIGIRRTKEKEVGTGEERFYPKEMAFPLTAFLRPPSKLRAADASKRDYTLDLVDPVRYPYVGQGASALPLETDLTTPLAYMWSRTDLDRFRWKGLLRPGAGFDRAGLMLLHPYEPDKIPVVMVHGLASTSLAWIPMLNELLRDPVIRKRYQFLLYLYPTGAPITMAAGNLRDSLLLAERTFNPEDRRRPEFDQMVLLGHSMGGLLAHAVAVKSGNRFWELNSDRRFEEILGPPDVLAKLRHDLFFDALPFVSRVVFLATPHRGSDYSRRAVGRLSSSLIAEPDHVGELLARLLKDNPDAFDRKKFRHLPTSIETLDPDSPVLGALLSMEPGPNVKFHSIIGSDRPGGKANSTDGVVSYRSTHLEEGGHVESERVVRSDHGVQKNPEAIQEVRRILLKHVGVVAQTPLRPVASEETVKYRP